MTIRNSFYNILGLGLPLIVAVIAIPALLRSLGVEQFGILTIIWAVVSYFGLFDLGLGRAVTQQVAACVAAGDDAGLKGVVGTSTILMLALGMAAALLMATTAHLLAGELTQSADPETVARAFLWMAVAMPAIVLTSGFRGVLEALGRFDLVNFIRLPMGIFTYGGPLITVWLGFGNLETIAAVLCFGRILACAIHAYFARRCLPVHARGGRFEGKLARPLLSMGGWITVTNVISPIMNYTDRFLIGIAVSAAAVTYYATPQEIVLRIGVIPTAITAVLFPVFAARSIVSGEADQNRGLWTYTLAIFGLLIPLTIALVLGAERLLAIWISTQFAEQAARILQIMAVAALFSGLAQVPFTMLQASGRADTVAKLHLLELPLYLGLLWVLVLEYGVLGAALAWLARIAVDMIALFCLCLHGQGRSAQSPPGSTEPDPDTFPA